jgi:hypothetical protein
MSTKSKKKAANNQKTPANTSKAPAKTNKAPVVVKERGAVLTIALIVIVIHSIVAAYMYSTLKLAPEIQRPAIITLTVIHFLANIVAVGGIFYWKKWGLQLYAASALIGIIAGTLAAGLIAIFYLILPLVILGYIVRSKRPYFD